MSDDANIDVLSATIKEGVDDLVAEDGEDDVLSASVTEDDPGQLTATVEELP